MVSEQGFWHRIARIPYSYRHTLMNDIRTPLVNFRKHHDSNRWRGSKSVFCGEPNDYECLVKLIGC